MRWVGDSVKVQFSLKTVHLGKEIVNKEELAKKSGKVSHYFDGAMTFSMMTLNIFDFIPIINNNDTTISNECHYSECSIFLLLCKKLLC